MIASFLADSVAVFAQGLVQPHRTIGLEWVTASNGEPRAVDYGSETDTVRCTVSAYGTLDQINTLRAALRLSQDNESQVSISEVRAPLFGVEIDYSQSVTAHCINIGEVVQLSRDRFSFVFELEAAQYSFLPALAELPILKPLGLGYIASDRMLSNPVRTIDSVRGGGEYRILSNSRGGAHFVGQFLFNSDDMRKLLAFWRTNRNAAFDLPPIPGVTYPFGILSGSTGLRARLYRLDGIEQLNGDYHRCTIEFSEVYSG